MGQAKPIRPTALVVEDDLFQSSLACTLLEEAEFAVVECQSAEAALVVLRRRSNVTFVFTDVNLAGSIDGLELAAIIRERYPRVTIVLTSGNIGDRMNQVPSGTQFMPKPWLPLELLVTAERVRAHRH